MKNKKEQTKSTSETDVSKAEWCIRALDGNELNAPKQSGLYHVTMTHSDVVNAGLPAELCNENHNIKALLLVSENNGKENRQKDKHIFQMLIFGSCKSSATNIYSRSCTYADGAPQWDEWVKMVDNGMLKSELREFKDKMLVPVTWDANSHADTFVAPGTYNLTGERLNLYDGLPIANAAPGHTINAHLVVLDSSISGTGESDDKCITQILTLSNRTSGDGDVYIRTGRSASLEQLAEGNCWEQWGKLQQNVEVGQVTSLNAFIDNGIYSGLYTNGSTFFETFVMVVINNYAVAGATGRVRSISQFKYALGIDGNFSYKTRTARGGDEVEWGSWVDLGAADTTDIQDGAITAQKLSSALLAQINKNSANATKAANGAYWTFGPNAVTLNINKNDGTVGWQTLPAATDENAGVMTAEDKKEQSLAAIAVYNNALNGQAGGNIFDKNAVGILENKMWLDIFGNIKDMDKYNISDYIAVIPGETYTISNVGLNPHGYDINKKHTVSISVTNGIFTVPEGTYWIRVAYYQGWSETFCINKGTEILPDSQRTFGLIRTNRLYDGAVTADKITDSAVTEEKIADASVTLDKLSDEVKNIVLSIPIVVKKNGAFIVKGNLSSGETLSLPQNSVEVGEYITFSANIDGEFNVLYVGHGKNEGAYMKIAPTTVTAYSHVSSPAAEQTFEHGLTIENNIQVYIEKKKNSTTDLRISSNGKEYKFFYSSWYGNKGTPFAESEGSELKDCTLSWTCKGINSDIWAFGDSYFGVTGTIRWMAYLIAENHTNLIVNGFGGQGSVSAYTDLTNLLTIGTPKKILWCLGMNDADSSTEVNADWLNTYNSLKSLCEDNNIELILATIPTVPTRVNKFKNEIVRSSGYRCIDFDKAVGADETTGEWFGDMLSSDGVHPSETGALALYNRAVADMPELLNC